MSTGVIGGGVTSAEADGDKAFASALAAGNPPSDPPPCALGRFPSRAIRSTRSTELPAELTDRLCAPLLL